MVARLFLIFIYYMRMFKNKKVGRHIIAFILFLAVMPKYSVAQQLYYSGYVGETIHIEGPDMGPYIKVLGCDYTANNSSQLSVIGYNYSQGAKVTILKYFSGYSTITCKFQYQFQKANGRYEVDYATITYYISSKATRITLNKNEVKVKPGDEFTLSYTTDPYDSDPLVEWTTSNKEIAAFDPWKTGDLKESVSLSGTKSMTVKAIRGGTCVITAKGGGSSSKCNVTVYSEPPKSIKLKPESLTLQENKTGTFTYELTPSDAYAEITWSSSDESIATVNANGVVTAKKEGTAKITAKTDNGLFASGTVTVTPQPQSVSLPNSTSIPVGYAIELKPTLTPSNASTTYTWASDNTAVASVDALGVVKGISNGSANITVTTANGKKGSARITVVNPSEGMDVQNVGTRVRVLKDLIKKSLNNIK